jgi:hypothetical protein
MRKLTPVLAACALLSFAIPAFADFDLGISGSPPDRLPTTQPLADEEWIRGLHAGAGFNVLYLSWDALALPSAAVADFTAGAYCVPAFLNLWDVGINVPVGPLFGFLEAGASRLYVYQQGLVDQPRGANTRVGAGLRLHWIGVSVSATTLFDSFGDLGSTFRDLASVDRPAAWQRIKDRTFPSLMLSLYF